MANTVIALRKSATIGATPGSLANGELAINYADGVIYYRAANGSIASISSGTPSFGTISANGTLLIADQVNDYLTINPGDNITIVGDAINDKLTINANLTAANSWANTKLSNGTVTLAGSLTTTGTITANGYVYINPESDQEGGEIQLNARGTNTNWKIDAYQNNFRVFAGSGSTVSNVYFFHATGGTLRMAVNKSDASYTVDVNGDVNITGTYRVNGVPLAGGTSDLTPANNWSNTLYSSALATGNSAANSANAYSVTVGAAGNNYTNSVGIAGNNYTVSVGASSNAWTNSIGTAGNNYTNSVGVAGNNYSISVGASSNAWTNAVGTAGNNYTNAVGIAGNNYMLTTTAADRAYTNTSTGSSNAWANAVGTAGNNFTISVGASSNAWANSINVYSDATYLKKTGGTITGDLQVTGNLNIIGNVTFTNTNSFVVSDPLIYLAGNNYISDIVDIGFIANYVNTAGANVHTGLYREHTDKEYYLFQGYDKEPINNHIGALSNNMTLAVLNADLRTSNLILGGANAITTIANNAAGANGWSNTKVASIANVTGRIWANATTTSGLVNYRIDLANTGVTPAVYGNSTIVPVITVDGYGRITAVSNVALTSTGGGASVTVSATPPSSPSVGNLWWDSDSGRLFIYYTDVDTSQWVEAVQSGGGGSDATAGTIANAAFDKANSANVLAYNTGISVNVYTISIGAAGNNWTNTIASAANNWANTKLSNTSGVSFNGNLYFPTGKVGIGNTTPNLSLEIAGNMSVRNFIEYDPTISADFTLTAGRNALTAGPVTINSGVTVTVPTGTTWTVV